jgi:hypothetical protein
MINSIAESYHLVLFIVCFVEYLDIGCVMYPRTESSVYASLYFSKQASQRSRYDHVDAVDALPGVLRYMSPSEGYLCIRTGSIDSQKEKASA